MHERICLIGFVHLKCLICTPKIVYEIVLALKSLWIQFLHLRLQNSLRKMQICKFTKHSHKLRQISKMHWKCRNHIITSRQNNPLLQLLFFFKCHGPISERQFSLLRSKIAMWHTNLRTCKVLCSYKFTFNAAISGFENACTALGCHMLLKLWLLIQIK